jgi:phosphohistidine phosphatase
MTTRTLVILRHAKTERAEEMADIDRPLTRRGHADAGMAGAWLSAHGYRPDLVLCSPARRTRQTWHGIAMGLTRAQAPEVRYEPAIYTGGVDDVLALVQTVPDEFGTVLLVGHNPTLSAMTEALDPEASRDSDGLSTCGIAVHEVDESWSALRSGFARRVAAHTARAEG